MSFNIVDKTTGEVSPITMQAGGSSNNNSNNSNTGQSGSFGHNIYNIITNPNNKITPTIKKAAGKGIPIQWKFADDTINNLSGQIWVDHEGDWYIDDQVTYSGSYKLNKTTMTWEPITWDIDIVSKDFIWDDGTATYYSFAGRSYKLNKNTMAWESVTFSGISSSDGTKIFKGVDGNCYQFYSSYIYKLNPGTTNWMSSVYASSVSSGRAVNIWTDGTYNYYSDGSSRNYKIDFNARSVSQISFSGLSSFMGMNVWNIGTKVYCFNGDKLYTLNGTTWELVENNPYEITIRSKSQIFYADDNTYAIDGILIYKFNESLSKFEEIKTHSENPIGIVISGNHIWTDGEDIYFYDSTYDAGQFILNKKTLTWDLHNTNKKDLDPTFIWTDGSYIYYSCGNDQEQYVFDKFNNVWIIKEWNNQPNGTSLRGDYIWTDGKNIYYSNKSVYNKATEMWEDKTWTGLDSSITAISNNLIWTDGENIYYSYNAKQYVLNVSTSTWSQKTWSGLESFSAGDIWSNGEDYFYKLSHVLNKKTGAWETKNWDLTLNYVSGSYFWTDGTDIYYSAMSGTNNNQFKIIPNYIETPTTKCK